MVGSVHHLDVAPLRPFDSARVLYAVRLARALQQTAEHPYAVEQQFVVGRRVDVRLGNGGVNAYPLAAFNALLFCIPQKDTVDLFPRRGRDPFDAMSKRRLARGLLGGGEAAKAPIRVRVCQVEAGPVSLGATPVSADIDPGETRNSGESEAPVTSSSAERRRPAYRDSSQSFAKSF